MSDFVILSWGVVRKLGLTKKEKFEDVKCHGPWVEVCDGKVIISQKKS